MTCLRRYTFTFLGDSGHSQVFHNLQAACDERTWLRDPEVRGRGLGVVQVVFLVSARDQWWAHKRAMTVMTEAAWPMDVAVPEWENLPPHMNRGGYRLG